MKMLLALLCSWFTFFAVTSNLDLSEDVVLSNLDSVEEEIVSEIILRSLNKHYSDLYKKTKDNLSKGSLGFSDESKSAQERIRIATNFILELENLIESDFDKGNIEGISDEMFNETCQEIVLKKSNKNILSQRNICRALLPLAGLLKGGTLVVYGIISLINDIDGNRTFEYFIASAGLVIVFVAIFLGVANWYSSKSGIKYKEEERNFFDLKLKKDELLSLAVLKRNECIRQYNDWSMDSKEEFNKICLFIDNSEERLRKSFNVMLRTLKRSPILDRLKKELSIENEYNRTAPGIIFIVERFREKLTQNNKVEHEKFVEFISDPKTLESMEKMKKKDSKKILRIINKAKKEIHKSYKTILNDLKNSEIVKCLGANINHEIVLNK